MPCTQRSDEVAIPTSINLSNSTSVDVADSNYAKSNDAKAELAKCVSDQTFKTIGTRKSSDKNSNNMTSNSMLFDVESKVVPKKEDHKTHCDPGSGIVQNLDQDVAGLNERSIHQDVTDGPLEDIGNEFNFQILASIISSDHPVSPKNPISTVSELSRNFSNKSKEVEFQVHDEKSPMSVGSTVKLDECFLSHNEYGSVIPSEASVNNSKGERNFKSTISF